MTQKKLSTERLLKIEDSGIIREIFGVRDRKLALFEEEFGVTISLVSEGVLIKGATQHLERAVSFIRKLISLAQEGISLDKQELTDYLHSLPSRKTDDGSLLKIKVSSKKKTVMPKTEGQRTYVNAIADADITFAVGPAGTGKTYLAMAMAVSYLMKGAVRRIILTRPAIEAGESLGFLPGDMYAKLGPYLRPLYDALYDMMEAERIEEYMETGIIEIAPLAYMRGRTLNNAFVILDEAQNCTTQALRMFLTRLGFDSKTVIAGDITQSDLPGGKPEGLAEALKILKGINGIQRIHLSNKDVVRHPVIQEIVEAYERIHSQE